MFAAIFYAIDKKPMKLDEFRRGDWWGILCMAIGLGSLIAMLEEGQRKDWFGSPFIVNCAILAAIFVPLFIVIELVREKPFVNLRLLGSRNLGFTSVVAFGLGLALYGTVFLIPLFARLGRWRIAVLASVTLVGLTVVTRSANFMPIFKGYLTGNRIKSA